MITFVLEGQDIEKWRALCKKNHIYIEITFFWVRVVCWSHQFESTDSFWHESVLISFFMIYHHILHRSYIMSATILITTAPKFTPKYSEVRIAQSLNLYVMFCGSLFSFFSFFFWPFYCLIFLYLRRLITPSCNIDWRFANSELDKSIKYFIS